MATAQFGSLNTDTFTRDDNERLRAETAELYASSIAKLAEIIEKAIREDSGTTVIEKLRDGDITELPGITTELRTLVNALKIKAKVIDSDPGADVKEVDERIVIYVSENDLQKNVARSDIEREAERNGNISIARIQNGKITGRHGAFNIPAEFTDIPAQGIGTWIGASGNDKITSGDRGSAQMRVQTCAIDHYGTGVTQKREIERTTYLGKDPVNVYSAWTEVSADCSPEYERQVQFFDNCPGTDGKLGTADDDTSGQILYEATQWVRNARRSDPDADPFKTEIFLDLSTATLVDLNPNISGIQSRCTESDRDRSFTDFLVNGRTEGAKELDLKTSTSADDIGNGPGKVPRVPDENASDGGTRPVSGIPFPANDLSDFQFTRTCAAEYGTIVLPVGFSGPNQFTGNVNYYRDYNRRETYFSDNTLEYILNYDLVLDPNRYGHPNKLRGPVSTTYGAGPDGDSDGWYKFTETCAREITRPESQTRQRTCSVVHPSHPIGTVNEQRNGTGYYEQATTENPRANGPTLTRINWNDWYETSNTCYHTTVERTIETRTIMVSRSATRSTGSGRDREIVYGRETCDQPQERVRVVTTNHYLNGGEHAVTTYDPDWTNKGNQQICRFIPNNNNRGLGGEGGGEGGEAPEGEDEFSFDVDNDNRGNYTDQEAAREADHPGAETGENVPSGCGVNQHPTATPYRRPIMPP